MLISGKPPAFKNNIKQNKPTTNKWFALEINHFSVSYNWATLDIHKNVISAAVSQIFEESVNY